MMRGFCPRGFCPEGAHVLMELCMEGVLSEGVLSGGFFSYLQSVVCFLLVLMFKGWGLFPVLFFLLVPLAKDEVPAPSPIDWLPSSSSNLLHIPHSSVMQYRGPCVPPVSHPGTTGSLMKMAVFNWAQIIPFLSFGSVVSSYKIHSS